MSASPSTIAAMAAAAPPSDRGTIGSRWDWPLLMFLLALPLGVWARVSAGWSLPLWFDETFTGTIAAQASFRDALRWCLTELTGPAFYLPLWLWVKAAGTSDFALRAPSLLLSVAAPLLLAWRGHTDRDLRLAWAALALLWLPMLPMATEARPYPQLFFLASAQAILFMRVVEMPSRGLAAGWAALTALAGLTHYYSLLIGGFQGIVLMVAHRRTLKALLPAAIPLAALGAWMLVHLPFVLSFTAGRADHYQPLPLEAAATLPMMLFGIGLQGFAVLALILVTFGYWWRGAAWRSPEALLFFTGAAAFAVLFALGFFKPTMMPRYVTSTIPALLFGVAAWLVKLRPKKPVFPCLAFASLVAAMLQSVVQSPADPRFRERRHFEFETASAWLGERSPSRLIFLWSTATGEQSSRENLTDLAGFFFRRSGHPVDVRLVRIAGAQTNQALLSAAASDPRSAILWMSDDDLPAGIAPMVSQLDPRWKCRDFGGERVLVYACRRRLQDEAAAGLSQRFRPAP